MIKKILMAGGVVVFVCVLVFVGLLFWAQGAGTDLQSKFFTAVETGDVKQVQALMHPALREEVDEPLLAAWMAELRKDLGEFQGLNPSDFRTSTKYEGGATITESEGTVNFERGTASSKLVFRDDLLVEFLVESDKIPKGWFKGPKDSKIYRQRGEELLRLLLTGEEQQAHGLLHKGFQKQMPPDKLRTTMSGFVSKAGKLRSIAYTNEEFETSSQGQRLTVRYDVQCANRQAKGMVEFLFIGLKGHIAAFHVDAKKE